MTDREDERLLPLWSALADLFLDTDVMLCVPHVTREVRASGLPLHEVEHILRWRVRPAFYHNLLSVAGEWAGWHDDIVRAAMMRNGLGLLNRLFIGRDRFFPTEAWIAIVAEVNRSGGDR